MSNLWVSLKRDKILAEIFYKGERIMTINVSEQNRGSNAVINLQDCKDIKFKIIKDNGSQSLSDDNKFNKEEFNKSSEIVDIIQS